MEYNNNKRETLEGVLGAVQKADLPPFQRRDMTSAIKRVCEMAGATPATLPAEAPAVRAMLAKIRPAAHGVSPKTWSNLLSRFRAALRLAGVIEPASQGSATRHPAWAPLVQAIAEDKRLSCGLASFLNWSASQDIDPEEMDNAAVQQFHGWLETRTLCPKPRDVVRRVPHLWNEASEKFECWPEKKLTPISFKSPPKRRQWCDLGEGFRHDVEAYLAMRAQPDPFDESPSAPPRSLAATTLRQQREHLRLSASVLIESGVPVEKIACLADLVEPERFKAILLPYHLRANRRPNAFIICLAQTLIQVAKYHVLASEEFIAQLKRIAAKLPGIPHELTPKNKALLRQFESDQLKAKLFFLPEQLMAEVITTLATGPLDFVRAQVAIAIDFQLAIPLRPRNLSRLNWRRHFSEPDGPKGRLLLHIPKEETKSRKQDFTAEVPEHVARRLRWYRRQILSRLITDLDGDLFVTEKGCRKDQKTLAIQIIKTIERSLGIHMTPHQFRHLCGTLYLEENPEDLETAKALLGHAWTKTTLIYVGSSSRRASRAYGNFVLRQRDKLKLKRKRKPNCKSKKGAA